MRLKFHLAFVPLHSTMTISIQDVCCWKKSNPKETIIQTLEKLFTKGPFDLMKNIPIEVDEIESLMNS